MKAQTIAPANPTTEANAALAWLKAKGSPRVLDGMARYGLPSANACGVPINVIQRYARQLGRDHALAGALWATGLYEARLLAAYVDDPAGVTAAQMDRWCADFDNWGVVDTVCFVLFDRSPHAWRKVAPWTRRQGEFQKRAGFVLIACLAAHDKKTGDAGFLSLLPLIEQGAADGRNFVKKGVSWALRMIGERSPALHAAAIDLARRLAASTAAPARWVGRDALRQLARPAVQKRLAARARG